MPQPDADGDTACTVCGRLVSGTAAVCFCCRVLAGQLGLPLVRLTAVVTYRLGDRTHRLLRGYKDDPAGESRAAYSSELAALLSAWLASSGAAFSAGGGGAWTVVTGVPSTCRPGRAPVEHLIEAVPELAAGHRRLLGRGTGPLDHLVADRSGFALAAGVERAWLARQRVLVVDDSTVTGARAQSAAAALRLAGARVAGVLAVGRALPASGPVRSAARPTVGSG